MAYVNVGRCTHRVLEHIGSADDALSGVGTSSGEALIVAVVRGLELAHSPRDRGDSVRGGRVAAPGVSVTAHLPTIEHITVSSHEDASAAAPIAWNVVGRGKCRAKGDKRKSGGVAFARRNNRAEITAKQGQANVLVELP
ncbi:uncharacterized protein LOC116414639 isoform X1 [Apis florea]|uniref:uncharacterized protein LOC116414639 isoform X1 n=1 Tax=Apis florea TaxID=7463 RepID=UPI0012FF0127|nr:uncharacterized protein LOC116414639 isoform X1 [Apis florea]